MTAIYKQTDLAIGAPGVSQFERACCGVPTILIAQNERQEALCGAWAATGAAMQCGPKPANVAAALKRLVSDSTEVRTMRERGLSVVDGQGAARLAAALKARLVY
jgi:spore coat polysaccharide biosynthesis predicted glycosyltransferase SpsG